MDQKSFEVIAKSIERCVKHKREMCSIVVSHDDDAGKISKLRRSILVYLAIPETKGETTPQTMPDLSQLDARDIQYMAESLDTVMAPLTKHRKLLNHLSPILTNTESDEKKLHAVEDLLLQN